MKTYRFFLFICWLFSQPLLAQNASNQSATTGTQPGMAGGQPAPLPTTSTPATPQPGLATPTNTVIHPIIPVPVAASPSLVSGGDWVMVYDLCAGKDQAALYLTNSKGVIREKPFLKRGETVRMVVTGNNPTSGKLVINTSGVVTVYDTTNGLVKLAGITAPKPPAPPGMPGKKSELSNDEQAIVTNQKLIDNYRAALEAERTKQLLLDCISEATLQSYYEASVPDSPLSRADLLRDQQQRLAKLPDGDVKRDGQQSLGALQIELDHWEALWINNSRKGALAAAVGNDHIQFSVARRSADGTNSDLLSAYYVPVYGNFRVNISTGFLFNRLVDYSYLAIEEKVWQQANSPSSSSSNSITSEPTSATGVSRKLPVLDSPGWGSVGIGALAHFYVTTRSIVTPAFTVGASLNASGKYTAMAGGSLILGHDQRIVLTAGYSLGPVARLQEPFREGVAYEQAGATFPTSTRTEGGWTFGLTWNLSSKRTVVLTP